MIPAGGARRRVHARVRGRVQGVGFRATTLEVARRLGLGGWVRNREDGDVELEAEGPAFALDQLVAFLHTGPRGAHVTTVDLEWLLQKSDEQDEQDEPGDTGPLAIPFEVRRTV